LPITVSTLTLSRLLSGYRPLMLFSKVRGTVHGVVSASLHLLWYLDWQLGGATARPALRPRPARPAHARRAA
jgi:hypothetical protein